jgi:Na+-translocating ferredoxin:NAD+ oxidoreductase RnfG subunit
MRAGLVLGLGLAAGMVLGAVRLPAQEVLVTPDEALREIFPELKRNPVVHRELSDSNRAELTKRLGRPVSDTALDVITVYDSSGALRGYAVITDEVGKYRPITFMVGVTPGIAVREVVVLVYRESRGGDVKRRRFLSQYDGKTARDPIDLDHDIMNVSGATISVRSMNAGVKRVLAELALLYLPSGGRP